jgi:hypothetical protein
MFAIFDGLGIAAVLAVILLTAYVLNYGDDESPDPPSG